MRGDLARLVSLKWFELTGSLNDEARQGLGK